MMGIKLQNIVFFWGGVTILLKQASSTVAFSTVFINNNNVKNRKLQLPASVTIQPPQLSDKNDTTSPDLVPKNPFELISCLASSCLYHSYLKKDAGGKAGGGDTASGTNWIDEEKAFLLKNALDRTILKLTEERNGLDRDEAFTWIRWMRSSPTPILVDLTHDFRKVASETILTNKMLDTISCSRDSFLNRLSCRIILLPSGVSLNSPLSEPPGSIVYGKLLYGGVTRYRILQSSNSNRPPRQTGAVTEIKATSTENPPVWMQYGGANRMYDAVDMGPVALLEVILSPQGALTPIAERGGDMTINRIMWSPEKMFGFLQKDDEESKDTDLLNDILLMGGDIPMTLSGKERNEAFTSDFQSSVGGLAPQIESIVRRVLDGRVIRPADDKNINGSTNSSLSNDSSIEQDKISADLSVAAMEAEELALLGLTPVRGLLLYGPPGCGKTILAREISRALRARSPKIITAPELLDRWVGSSEKLVRGLFADAEAELTACNGDSTKSALHVIVIDEIDAVFRKRSPSEDSGETTRSSVVNQILSKLDGVDAIPNVLFIGMTNRRELLDDALLRPGRLEVQIEIPLPDKIGRREILQIHFDALRERGRLSKPLCCAIDGVADYNGEINTKEGSGDVLDSKQKPLSRRRRAIKRLVNTVTGSILGNPTYDLASDYATSGFSGADIAGLVRCAGSIALSRARKDGGGVNGLLITLDDVKEALVEVQR